MKDASPRLGDPFVLLTAALLFGNLLMTRTFAHYGVRPLYVGELALGTYLVARPTSLALPWLGSLAMPTRLSMFSWWLALWLGYGVFECFRGLGTTNALSLIGEVFVVHLYPFYVLVGVWVGTRHPNFLPRLMPVLAWIHGLYGLVFIAVLSPLGLVQSLEEPTVIPFFGTPAGDAIVLLGLLAFSRGIRRDSIPLLLNLLVMICMQRRAVWVAFTVAITLWACLSGRMKQFVICVGLVVCTLIVGLIPGVEFPSPGFRGKPLSTYDVIGRMIAPFDPEAAASLSPDAEDFRTTAHWRSEFWSAIWKEVHATDERMVVGLGYDYPLWQLHPGENLDDNPVRTPHSIFLFVLGYSGWLGVVIFAGLQVALARLMWRTYRETGEAFGIALWTLAIVWALIDPLLERPYGAIPLYLLMGLAAARVSRREESLEPQSNPDSGYPLLKDTRPT